MERYKGLIFILLLMGIMIGSLLSASRERENEGGDKIPLKLGLGIQYSGKHCVTMSSVNGYMAINHGYRYRHRYETHEAVHGLLMVAQDSGAAFANNLALIVIQIAQASYSKVSDCLCYMSDKINQAADIIQAKALSCHLPEKIDRIAEVLNKAGYGEVNHTDMIPALLATFGILVGQFFYNVHLDWRISVEFLKKVFREGILGMWQLYQFVESSSGCSLLSIVEVPLEAATITIAMVTGMILVLVVFVMHQTSCDSHSNHDELHPDCPACRELGTMLDMAEQAHVQMSDLLKGVDQVNKAICEVREEVDAIKKQNKQKQVDLIEYLDQGSTLIKRMQECDTYFRIQNGYEPEMKLQMEDQVNVLLEGVHQVNKAIFEIQEEVDTMKAQNKQKQMDLLDCLEQGSALIRQMQECDKEFCIQNGYPTKD